MEGQPQNEGQSLLSVHQKMFDCQQNICSFDDLREVFRRWAEHTVASASPEGRKFIPFNYAMTVPEE